METMREHRGLLLFEGILFILLGILAIGLPGLFTLGVEQFLGWLFVIGGAVQAYRVFKSYHTVGYGALLVSALLYLVIGVLMLIYPVSGILTLTAFLTVFFLLEGISKILLGFQMHGQVNVGWLIFSGIVALLMAAIIISGWPATGLWVIGLLVGINMLFFGFSLLSLWLAVDHRS